MQFEESWYLIQLIGFRKLDSDFSLLENGSKRHQYRRARENIESNFSDQHIFKPSKGINLEDNHAWNLSYLNYHEPKKPKRDRKIKIKGPKKCYRCGRTDRLERDHIVRLADGGKDVSENLRWGCNPCHDFRHSEDELLEDVARTERVHGKSSWQFKMYSYRLEVLRKFNPPGAAGYKTYWDDPHTHYDCWYERPIKEKVHPDRNNMTLEAFVTS